MEVVILFFKKVLFYGDIGAKIPSPQEPIIILAISVNKQAPRQNEGRIGLQIQI